MLRRFLILSLIAAASQAQTSTSRVLLDDDVFHKGAYYDVDLRTTLSRPQVGDMQADLRWQGNVLQPVGEARFELVSPERFLVHSASGCVARIDVRYATLRLTGDELTLTQVRRSTYNRSAGFEHLGVQVALQLDGSDVFPEPLEMLSTRQSGEAFELSWPSGEEVLVESVAPGGEATEVARGGSPLTVPAAGELELRIVRLLADGGQSIPLRRQLYAGAKLVSALVEASRGRELVLDFRGGERLNLTDANNGIECSLLPGGLRSLVEAHDFRAVEWEQPSGFVGGETYLLRFPDMRVAKVYFDPTVRVAYSRGTTSSRGVTLSLLTEATHNPAMRQHWVYLADGSWSLQPGPVGLARDVDGLLGWEAREGAVEYVVKRWLPEKLDFEVLGQTAELSFDPADAPGPWVVEAVLADGTVTAGALLDPRTRPEGWEYGSFELGMDEGFLFESGTVVEKAEQKRFVPGSFDIMLAQVEPMRLQAPRSFFPSQTVFGEVPPLFELRTSFLSGRGRYDGVPSTFWLQTQDGTFVQLYASDRGSDKIGFEYFFVIPDRDAKIAALLEEYPRASEADLAQVDATIPQLASADPDQRSAAEDVLRGLKAATIHRFGEIFSDDTWPPEVWMRMESLLEEFWSPTDANDKR